MDQSSKKIIILGWYLGLGALIQSSVNSIWLAKKLGRQYFLYWGHSCIYQPGMIGSSCKNLGNIYPKLFSEPVEHADFTLQVGHDMTIYPRVLNQVTKYGTVDELDACVASIAGGQTLPVNAAEIHDLLTAEICIIYQYLSIPDAIALVRAAGLEINEAEILSETAEIYKEYFKLSPEILQRANDFWCGQFSPNEFPVGIHIRGSDKITETAIPSPSCYFKRIARTTNLPLATPIFVATDQGSCLDAIRKNYSQYHIVYQDISRSQGDLGLHFTHQRSDYAFQHAVDVVLDVETLSRCSSIYAFPGSQIYWWLNIKKTAEKLPFQLYDVKPSMLDKYKALRYAFRAKGLRALRPLLSSSKRSIVRLFRHLCQKIT